MSLSKSAAEALRYLGTVRNFARTTLDSYQWSLDQFLHYLHGRGCPDDIRQFSGDNVYQFVAYLGDSRKLKASSITVRLTALSTIARVLMKLKDTRGKPILTQDPTRTFEWPTIDIAETKFLLPAELRAFLGLELPLREAVARDLVYDTAARAAELCRANVGDLVTADGKTFISVTVKGRGKRFRRKHIPVSSPVASLVFEYLMARDISNPSDPTCSAQPLLLTSDNRRWTRTGLSNLMARIGHNAGITRLRTSSHKLRHTANVVSRFARKKDGSGLDRWVRSQLLTHDNPRSIDRYDHLFPEELFEAREAQRDALETYLRLSDRKAPG